MPRRSAQRVIHILELSSCSHLEELVQLHELVQLEQVLELEDPGLRRPLVKHDLYAIESHDANVTDLVVASIAHHPDLCNEVVIVLHNVNHVLRSSA